MKKHVFYTEFAYLIGLALIALGAALMARSDLGVSMIVAPAYILHLKLSLYNPFFTFGITELFTQIIVLILMWIVVRRVLATDLICFVSAFIYGFLLDRWVSLCSLIPVTLLSSRIIVFVVGMLICALGVAFVFHTYIPCQSYDYFVKRVTQHFQLPTRRVKTCFDLSSLAVGVVLSFAFFGFGTFRGIGVGTVVCAFVNGTLISLFSKGLEKRFEFKDRWRKGK